MPYGGIQTANAELLDGLDSTDFVQTADMVTKVGDPGADDKVPSEQAVREALAAAGGAAASANLLDNAEFAIDQRNGGAARNVANIAYAMDRWYILCNADAPTVERIDSGLHTCTSASRLTLTAPTSSKGGLAQAVELVKSRPTRGRTLQLQARVRFNSAATIYYAVLEWTGAADTPMRGVVLDWDNAAKTPGNFFKAAVTGLTLAVTGTREVEANTWTAIADSAAISTDCNNLIVFIWAETAGVLDITETDIFAGSEARVWAPKDPGADRVECQRHCYVYQSTRQSGYRQGNTQVAMFYPGFPVPMRITPTPSHNISGWSNSWAPGTTEVGMYNAVTANAVSITGTLTINILVIDQFLWGCTFTAATSFNGNAGDIGAIGFGSDVRLIFSADL